MPVHLTKNRMIQISDDEQLPQLIVDLAGFLLASQAVVIDGQPSLVAEPEVRVVSGRRRSPHSCAGGGFEYFQGFPRIAGSLKCSDQSVCQPLGTGIACSPSSVELLLK
jgi:hypothetical protein